MKAIKKIIWKFLNYLGIGGAIQLHLASILKEDGWFKSFHKKEPIDLKGNPIPWYTYPAIAFLEKRLHSDMKVFEYGSGYSTRWLSDRVKTVKSVEDSAEWIELLKPKVKSNVELVHHSVYDGEDGAYAQEVKQNGAKYDLIIVDGLDRNNCVKNALEALTEGGVIILDNSERDIYAPGHQLLRDAGFRSIDFWGITPIVAIKSCTSVYYQSNNCLGI